MLRTILCSSAALALTAGAAAAEFTLHIHTNDFHSRIEAINAFDRTCPAEDAAAAQCFGGLARLAADVARRRGAIEAALGR